MSGLRLFTIGVNGVQNHLIQRTLLSLFDARETDWGLGNAPKVCRLLNSFYGLTTLFYKLSFYNF